MDYKITGFSAALLGSITYVCVNQSKWKDKRNYCLRFQHDWSKYDDIRQYLVDHYGDQIYDFTLGDDMVSNCSDWRQNRKQSKVSKLRNIWNSRV